MSESRYSDGCRGHRVAIAYDIAGIPQVRDQRGTKGANRRVQGQTQVSSKVEHAGGCVCGAVRFKATGEPQRVTVCHCLWCQRRTGTAFGVEAVFDLAQVEILGDAVARYRHVSDESGRWLDIEFCGRCGSNLGFTLEAVPGVRTLPAGLSTIRAGLRPNAINSGTSTSTPGVTGRTCRPRSKFMSNTFASDVASAVRCESLAGSHAGCRSECVWCPRNPASSSSKGMDARDSPTARSSSKWANPDAIRPDDDETARRRGGIRHRGHDHRKA